VALAIVCAGFTACTSADSKQKAQAAGPHTVSVAIGQVQKEDVPVYLTGLGAVTAFYTANIKSRVDGQIMRVNFNEGQIVKEGDLLIVIDPRPYQVQKEQMEAQLFKDQASLRDARLNLDRYTTLIPSGSIAQQQVDTQKSTVDQLDGQVRTDQAQIDNAKLQIVYCNITAAFTGRVGLRQVDPGNLVVNSSTEIIVVTQLQPISVLFALPEDSINQVMQQVNAGQKLPAAAYDRAMTTKLSDGTLSNVDNQTDQTTGMVKMRAMFDNQDLKLFPAQFVNIRLLLNTMHNQTYVPAAAIQHGAQGTYVYVIDKDRTANMRGVTTGPTDGDKVAITSGVAQGETVVVDGTDRLKDGATVLLPGDKVPAANASGTASPNAKTGKGKHGGHHRHHPSGDSGGGQ